MYSKILELVELAQDNEEKSYYFYSEISGKVKDDLKPRMQKMAEIEKDHMALLEKQIKLFVMMKKLETNNPSTVPSFSKQVSNSSNASIRAVFEELHKLSSADDTELVRKAIQREMEEIKIYKTLRADCPDRDARRIFEILMEQEERHYEFLSTLLNEILGTDMKKTTVNSTQLFNDIVGKE